MKFSNLILSLDFPHFKGFLKLGITKEYHNLVLSIELLQILFNLDNKEMNRQIMDTIVERSLKDPFDDSILRGITVNTRKFKKYSFPELEDLEIKLKSIKMPDGIDSTIIDFDGVRAQLDRRQLDRVKRFISSFLWNYNTINDTIRYFVSQNTPVEKTKETIQISKHIESNKTVSEVKSEENNITIECKDPLIEGILKFSPNSLILNNLIHNIFNFYRYCDESNCNGEKDNKKVIKTTSLFEYAWPDINYYNSFIESLKTISVDTVKHISKNILSFIEQNCNDLRSIHIKSCCYLLLINYIRIMIETHNTWLYENLEKILLKPSVQANILNKFTDDFAGKSSKICFDVVPLSSNCEETEFEIQLKDISNKYKHLIPISQKEFVDIIFKENIVPNKNFDFYLNSKKILDVTKFSKQNNVDSDLIKTTEYDRKKSFIDWEYNERVIGSTYTSFLNYIKNPSSILTVKDVSQDVLKTFGSLKSILNDSLITKEVISTFTYYNILRTNLPNFNNFSFKTILLIIFNIIIPYQNDFNSVIFFEDQFLI